MPTVPLPEQPSLDQLRNQARELQRAVRSGDAAALAHAAEHYPSGDASALSRAQLVIARHYGFGSWPRLSRHVRAVQRYSRAPIAVDASADPATEFLRLACLVYGSEDGPGRWSLAGQILTENPQITARSIHAAAAAADTAAVGRLLDADPRRARREGGPHSWQPLLYLAYARHDAAVDAGAVLETARLLLRHGADANAGYLWCGHAPPFTVLTGALGQGEQGPVRQPPHPHQHALARLLLDAGADSNDGQALYNRMFEPGNDHLELLFEYGLGKGDGGPWRARLPDAIASPRDMVRGQLAWAVSHDMLDRTQLLVRHGVEIAGPLTGDNGMSGGRTPVELARLCGYSRIAEYLVSAGAPDVDFGTADAVVAAAMVADRDAVSRIIASEPGVVDAVRANRPALIMRAAVAGRLDSVALLVELGFDVNALGRQDAPVEQPWETPLHHAASTGDVALARLLLSLGADPNVRDRRFDSAPLGWARHFDQPEMAALLEPLTASDEDGG
jgi:ankyrin repeat protein